PPEAVDRLRPAALAGGVDLVDRDDLAGPGLGQQILVVEAPPRGGVAAEALARELPARPRPHVDDADLEDIAGHRPFHRHRPRADVHAEALARPAPEERGLHRPGAPAIDPLALP